MAATITGRVFNDLNHNGVYNPPTETGIPNAYVVIQNPNDVCTTVQTNASGVYTFSNLNIAGNYTIYETAVNPGAACPPTTFGQPAGFTDSTTFRTDVVNVTATDITNSNTLTGMNFGHDNPAVFDCAPVGYQVAAQQGTNSEFLEINLVTGTVTTIDPDIGLSLNALGYNILDNMMYGIQLSTNNLIRLAADGTVTNFGPITNLPAPPPSYFVGDVDGQGHLFIGSGNVATPTYYVVDVNQDSPTFGQLLDPTAGFIVDTFPYGTTIAPAFSFADWKYNQNNNLLYAVESGTAVVWSINPFTGVATPYVTTGVDTGSAYGAVFMDATGVMYAINNTNGKVFRILVDNTLLTATGQVFSQSIPASFNDGAACPNANLSVDFGDAPDTSAANGPDNYSTLLANNGPRHQIRNELTLGTQVTGELDAYQNNTATGDDIPKGIQDDGLVVPLTTLLTTATTYSLTVTVRNNTGKPANLYGWVDFNQNGVFQGNESAPVQVVASSPSTQQVVLTFTVPAGVTLTPDHTFVRLRLTTDNLTNSNASPAAVDTRSLGPASDGEVEDYILEIADPQLPIKKTANLQYADIGDTITYTVTIQNPYTVPINDVTFQDSIATGTSFVPGSLTVSTAYTGTNIATGINITTITAGETVTITWQVKVNAIPSPNPIENIAVITVDDLPPQPTPPVPTDVRHAHITIIKTADITTAEIGDTVTYTLLVTNDGNVAANNVVVVDPVPAGTSFVTDSVTVGGVSQPGVTPNAGISIGTIPATGFVLVTFSVVVTAEPTPNPTNNVATAGYQYTVDPSKPPKNDSSTSNIVPLRVIVPELTVTKVADIECVTILGEITYTIVVTNTGNIDLSNVVITDPQPVGTSFVTGSVTIDGFSQPAAIPSAGINLGLMTVGQSHTITFSVKVDQPPIPQTITDLVNYSFSYNPDPYSTFTKTGTTGVVSTVRVNPNYFTQISVMENLYLPDEKPDAEEIDTVDAEVKITKKIVVVTPESPLDPITGKPIPNIEGKTLTGRKLILEGELCQKITYIASDPYQSVHSADFSIPFSTFIIIPKTIDIDPYTTVDSMNVNFNITALVEDIYVKKISDREIFKNATLFLQAIPGIEDCLDNPCEAELPIAINATCDQETISNLLAAPSEADPNKDRRWSQTLISEVLSVPQPKPDIEQIISVSACIEWVSQKVINTPTSQTVSANQEGSYLTGKKLIVEGLLKQKIMYTAANQTQSIHAAHFAGPFSAIIVLEPEASLTEQYTLEACIEHIAVKQISPRMIAKQTALFVKATPLGGGSCYGKAATSSSLGSTCPNNINSDCNGNQVCGCGGQSPIKVEGLCDTKKVKVIDAGSGIGNWRQVSVMEVVPVPTPKPDIESIGRVFVTIRILSQKIISTPSGTNLGGMTLTGKKLVIEGLIQQKVVYTAALPTQPLHSFHSSKLFSEFIVLPETTATSYCVDVCIEDVYVLAVDCRNVFKNLTLFLQARPRIGHRSRKLRMYKLRFKKFGV